MEIWSNTWLSLAIDALQSAVGESAHQVEEQLKSELADSTLPLAKVVPKVGTPSGISLQASGVGQLPLLFF